MSGICIAAMLRDAGVDTVTLYEKSDRLGGTWRDNTYPGVACDVPSHYYSFSFAPNPDWSRIYSSGGEIWAYLEDVARLHRVTERVRFGVEVTGAEWAGGHWRVELSTGETVPADFLVAATGVVHHIREPDLPGLESFAGARFHSARWDHSVPVDGARVGLVGSGSTGVQITGALAGRAAPLTLFQRTPQWVLPATNPRVPDRLRGLLRRFPAVNRATYRLVQSLVEHTLFEAVLKPGLRRRAVELACERNLRKVADPALRAKLTPDDQPMCRRLIVAPDYYEAVQRDDVHVVTERIERVEPAGVRTVDGTLHELDVLVLATGFDPHAFMRPMNLTGLDGRTLAEEWAKGARGYRSIALPGFPNFFMLLGPHSPFGNQSQITVAETQARHALGWIERWRRGELDSASPTDAAAERFNRQVRAALSVPGTVWVTGCNSWYLGDDGLPELWPWSAARHREVLAAPVDDDWEVRAVR
jgi:cation diffusion facilitator CzcD-associated flavoprotein CzcO